MIGESFLIVGLGNPGRSYDSTRHNIGFRVVRALAQKYGITFKPSLIRCKGSIGKGTIKEQSVQLLMPLTYMNESGNSVRKSLDYFKIPLDHSVVITDDIALPFGSLRLKEKGSSGGHNGLKSVEKHLGTSDYPRLRIGVGDRKEGMLADYVLASFTQEEQAQLPEIIAKAIEGIEMWLEKGAEAAMKSVNT